MSKIIDGIYISGVDEMAKIAKYMKNMNIQYIISCVPKESVKDYHNYVVKHNPNIVILHLPMDDTLSQNGKSESPCYWQHLLAYQARYQKG